MKIIVSFSGGKDSQACLIQAANKYGADKIEAVFCDTGWEHPDTYQHISNVCKQLDVRLVILRSKKYTDFVDMSIKRSRFPSSQRRFCTSELKIKPMIDYILSLTEPCLIIQGIRAKESEERAKLPYECNYFGEYFERVKKNRKGKVIEVWKQDYRRKDVLKWCEHYDASVSRPMVSTRSYRPDPFCWTKSKSFILSWIFPSWLLSLYYVQEARGKANFARKVWTKSLDRCRTTNERRNPKWFVFLLTGLHP